MLNKVIFWFYFIALAGVIPMLLEIALYYKIFNNPTGALVVAIAPVVLLSLLYFVVRKFLERFPKLLSTIFIILAILTIAFEGLLGYIWYSLIAIVPIMKF